MERYSDLAAVSAAENTGEGASAPDPVEVIKAAQARIARAIQVGHLTGDPLAEALKAQGATLAAQLALYQANVALAERGQVIDQAGLARIEKAAVRGADQRAADLARAHHRRKAMLDGAVLFVAVVISVTAGHWWGEARTVARVHETEQGLSEAFRAGPEAAAGWVNLMRLNDLPNALATCTGERAFTDQTGSRSCYLPVRLEPPKSAVAARIGR